MENLMKLKNTTRLTVVLMALLAAACSFETGVSVSSKPANGEPKAFDNYEYFVTKEGVECIALAKMGMSGRGVSCNWEKYNSGS